VIARVILKRDDKINKDYWLTADSDWLNRIPLLPDEDLTMPTRAFEVGTTIEIRGGLTKEAIDAGTKEKLP
jgi:hypothetical protein